MVKPVHFVFNTQTAEDNVFMNNEKENEKSLTRKAVEEFEGLVSKLHAAGIKVLQFEHSRDTPDSVFPNNWFSTHPNTELNAPSYFLYPMKTPNRRLEKSNSEIRRLLDERYQLIDFRGKTSEEFEEEQHFLEGTGSLVLDRKNHIVYCCVSQRSDPQIAKLWADILGYQLVTYSASYQNQPIYHTNVVMCVGTRFAIVCGEVITNEEERTKVFQSLTNNGKVIIDITAEQMNNFCGNALELRNSKGEFIVAMSSRAYTHLTDLQRNKLVSEGQITQIVHSDIDVIEKIGGGSVRCMIAEVY